MAVVYASGLRTTRMDAVKTAIDAGSGAGKIILYLANGSTEVATLTLNDPCGTVSGDVLTIDNDPVVTCASATGNAAAVALATIVTSADAVVVSGLTVGVGTGNIQVNSTTIAAGAAVTLTGTNTITHNTAG